MGSVSNGVVSNDSIMICGSLTSQSVGEIVSDMHQAKAQGADLVEVRMEYITNFHPRRDLQTILTNKPLPVLIVYR